MNLNISANGLKSAQKNLDVIANNIANETTEGYRRQVTNNEELPSIQSDGFYTGTGARTTGVEHTVDNIIYNNMLNQLGDKSFSESFSTYSQSIENLYQDNNSIGIGASLDKFFNTTTDLKNNMENEALEGVFVDDLNTLNENIHILNNNLEDLRKEVIIDLNNDISALNDELKELQTIVKELSVSFKPELADKQAMLEQSIMSKIDADVVYDEDGNYNLMIGNHRVLDKSSFRTLNTDNNQINIGNLNITDNISKGSISAKAQIAISDNNEIDKNIYKLDLMASSLIKETNAIYSSKAFESTRSIDFTTPEFEKIPLLDLPELKGLNPGNVTFQLHTDPVQEITINISHETTLEDFKNQLETESNGEILLSYGNNANVSIYSPNYPTNISNDENTNFKQVMGFNKLLDGYDSKTIAVNREIVKNPGSLFVSNDKLQNNVNYDILDGLADLQFKEVNYEDITKYNDYFNKEFFNPSNTRITALETSTIKNFYANITIDASRVVARSNDKLELQSKILETTTTKYEDNVKVDKDEELMSLMKYQAAYSANAKVITTMNELMDTILRM